MTRIAPMVLLAMVSLSGVAHGKPLSAEKANDLYERGNYEESVSVYEQLVDAGVIHEDVFYNLGNGLFRLGRLGPAIYNYERALKLDPGMEDAAYNASVAREVANERVVDRVDGGEPDGFWLRMQKRLSPTGVLLGLLFFSFGVFGLLVVLRFLDTGFLRTSLVALNSFFAVGLLVFGALVAGYVYYTDHVAEGIVLPDSAPLREGPRDESVVRGELHAGLRLRLVETRGSWTRIRLSNGVEGWVLSSSIGGL